MAESAAAGGAAGDATVDAAFQRLAAWDAEKADKQYREALADAAEHGVDAAKAHIKSLQDSLKGREAEAKRLRDEAKES